MSRLVLLLALSVVGCGPGDAVAPDPSVIATIDGAPLSRDDLELQFRVNLLSEADDSMTTADELDRVKSRLLDVLVAERALLAEAERRQLRVTDEEVDGYLELARTEETGGARLPLSARKKLAHQRLMIRKLQDTVAAEVESPTDEEVLSYVETNGDDPGTRRRVLLRALMFESEETASEVRKEIGSSRKSYAEAALAHEAQPGQAAPLTLDWAALSADVREALADLDPGEVSPPLEFHGEVYLFQVQAWLEDEEPTETERMQAARRELEGMRRAHATEALLEALLKKTEIQLQTEYLGFNYVPEAGS